MIAPGPTLRQQFPVFTAYPELAYLDHAATSQKPQSVIDAISDYYIRSNANIHRGIYHLANEATGLYEATREEMASYLNAAEAEEVIFTKGTTDGINLVAQSFLAPLLKAGDEVLISGMEHHANLIPWQQVCKQKGAHLKVIPVTQTGELDLDSFYSLLGPKTRMLAMVHVSNTLGTINPIDTLISAAKEKGIPVLIDAAQTISHYPIDVQQWGADFVVFSGHKMYGPTGIGILYGKKAHLERMQPYQVGGSMIRDVQFEETVFAPPPSRFEAGTPHIAGVAGLRAALAFLKNLDMQAGKVYLEELTQYAQQKLTEVEGLDIFGTAQKRAPIFSFSLSHAHPHDIATLLDADQIAVRAGNHCTQPLMDQFGLPGTARASLTFYNTKAEIDRLVASLKGIQEMFGG